MYDRLPFLMDGEQRMIWGGFNQLRSLVQFPEGYEPAVLVPLGYAADETAPKVRKDMSEVWE